MNITEKDIEIVKAELATKRSEYEKLKFSGLEEKLNGLKIFLIHM